MCKGASIRTTGTEPCRANAVLNRIHDSRDWHTHSAQLHYRIVMRGPQKIFVIRARAALIAPGPMQMDTPRMSELRASERVRVSQRDYRDVGKTVPRILCHTLSPLHRTNYNSETPKNGVTREFSVLSRVREEHAR